MRKLVYAINLTLDGCCDHTKGIGDEGMHDFHKQLLLNADTFLYGRKTYELMVPFWPDMAKNNSGETKEMNEFAQAFDAIKSIAVFSRTLKEVKDKKTTVLNGDLRKEVIKLKQQEGKYILMGGVDIPSQLIQLDLVDEYYIVIQPLLVGDGRRLLEGVSIQERLELADSKVFGSGCVALRYIRRPE